MYKKQSPTWISIEARTLFKSIMPMIEDTPANRETLAMLSQAYADYREAVRIIQEQGRFITTEHTTKPHPAFNVMKMSCELYTKLAVELNLTPKSKKGIGLVEADGELEQLLRA
jgi:P27 family predicted phage terminase small subunit